MKLKFPRCMMKVFGYCLFFICSVGALLADVPAEYVLFATNNLKIMDRVEVTGAGATIGANANVELGYDARIYTKVKAGQNIINQKSTVYGDVTAGQIIMNQNGGSFLGTVSNRTALPVYTIPVKDAPVGTTNNPQESTIALAPGTYGDFRLNANTTLVLSPGVYNFKSLIFGEASLIRFDKSLGGSYVEINIATELAVASRTVMQDYAPLAIYFYTQQSTDLNIGNDVVLAGQLSAPFAQVRISARASFSGKIYARAILVENDVHFTGLSANGGPATDIPGPFNPDPQPFYGTLPAGGFDAETADAAEIGAFSIFGLEEVKLLHRVNLDGAMIGSNNLVVVGIDSKVGFGTGSSTFISSGKDVILQDRAQVKGDVTVGGKITKINGAGIDGNATEGLILPQYTLATKQVPVSTTNFTLPNDSTYLLPPGTYGDVFVFARGTLIFSPGVYNFKTLRFEPDCTLLIQGTPGSEINLEINIAENFAFGARSKMVLAAGNDPQTKLNVKIYSNQTTQLVLDYNTEVTAEILAPKAEVFLHSSFTGEVYARKVYLDNDVKFLDYPDPHPGKMPHTVEQANQEFGKRKVDLIRSWIRYYRFQALYYQYYCPEPDKRWNHSFNPWHDGPDAAIDKMMACLYVLSHPEEFDREDLKIVSGLAGDFSLDVYTGKFLSDVRAYVRDEVVMLEPVGTDDGEVGGDFDFRLRQIIALVHMYYDSFTTGSYTNSSGTTEQIKDIFNDIIWTLLTLNEKGEYVYRIVRDPLTGITQCISGLEEPGQIPVTISDPDHYLNKVMIGYVDVVGSIINMKKEWHWTNVLILAATGIPTPAISALVQEGLISFPPWPLTLLSQAETENHALMINAWRFLVKNYLEWVAKNPSHPRFDARIANLYQNNLTRYTNSSGEIDIMLQLMGRTVYKDLHETNAKFYEGYSTSAIQLVASYANTLIQDETRNKVAVSAKNAMDYLATKYTFQSFEGKRESPMRRNIHCSNLWDLYDTDAEAFIYGILSGAYVYNDDPGIDEVLTNANLGQAAALYDGQPYPAVTPTESQTKPYYYLRPSSKALFSVLLDYRIPAPVHDFMLNKHGGYYSRIQSRYTRLDHDYDNVSAQSEDLGLFIGSNCSLMSFDRFPNIVNPRYFNPDKSIPLDGDFKPVTQLYFTTNDYISSAGGRHVKYYDDNMYLSYALDVILPPILPEPIENILDVATDVLEFFTFGLFKKDFTPEWPEIKVPLPFKIENLSGNHSVNKPASVLTKGPLYFEPVLVEKENDDTDKVNAQIADMAKDILFVHGGDETLSLNNLGTYKNFTYAVGTLAYPQTADCPINWNDFLDETISRGEASIKFFNFPTATAASTHPLKGYFLILGSIGDFIHFWEIVPQSRYQTNNVPDINLLKAAFITNNPANFFSASFNASNYYVMATTGEKLMLESLKIDFSSGVFNLPQYPTQFIQKIWTDASGTAELDLNTYYFDLEHLIDLPLISALDIDTNYQFTGFYYAYAMGDGFVSVNNPYRGESLVIDSRDYTAPLSRIIKLNF